MSRAAVRILVAAVATLAVAAQAAAGEGRPTLRELESEVVCPTCKTTLDQSNAPVADQMRAFIRQRIRAGDTKDEILDRLEDEYGPSVRASPPRSGFTLLAWVLPLALLAGGAVVVGALVWRWSRRRGGGPEGGGEPPDPSRNGRAALDPELERRVDEALTRFE